MWSDAGFRELSPIPPSGQGLWFFLLTGPHTSAVPGLFRSGRAGMAEELGWSVENFDRYFDEVYQKGMAKADFNARLVWLPNAIKHNRPESPNVVRSWRQELDVLPECPLKNEAIEHLREYLTHMGVAFVSAFNEILTPQTKPSSQIPANSENTSDIVNTVSSGEAVPVQQPDTPPQSENLRDDTYCDTPAIPLSIPSGQKAEKKPDQAKRKTRIPNDFSISPAVREWAIEKGFDRLDEHLENFITSCKAKDYTYVDWDSAFRNAIRKDWARIRENNPGQWRSPITSQPSGKPSLCQSDVIDSLAQRIHQRYSRPSTVIDGEVVVQ